MRLLKPFAFAFLVSTLFTSFAEKATVQKSVCGPHIFVNNYGSVNMSYAIIDNGYYDQEIFNLAPGNGVYTGQWSAGSGTMDIKMILSMGQSGSIRVYHQTYNNEILCEPTSYGTEIYRFNFDIVDCGHYIIEITTDPC